MKHWLFSMLILMGFAVLQASAAPKRIPADANKDGKVSKQEFCDAQAKKMEKAGKEFNAKAAEKQFAAKDKDGNGFLTAEELSKKGKGGKKAPKVEKEDDADESDDFE